MNLILNNLSYYLCLTFCVLLLFNCSETKNQKDKVQPNVLLLYMDDLRPELGCYGKVQIQSPNIDKLASSGILFNNAYCNVPVCGASRASMLTGMYPAKNRFRRIDSPKRNQLPIHRNV